MINIDNNTIMGLITNTNGNMEINVRRKRNLTELKGLIKLDYTTDSVELKKELY